MICENCLNQHDGIYGSGRFCSSICSRSFSTKYKRKEINEKISKKLLGTGNKPIVIICKNCNNKFEVKWKFRNQLFCSNKCSLSNQETKAKISEKKKIECLDIKERLRLKEIGRIGGFGKKGITKNGTKYQSNLEKLCFEYLENNKILFEPHKSLPGSSKISDLYIIHLNLWIEIDGINREKRKKWLGKNYEYWLDKLNQYQEKKLNMIIVYSVNDLKKIIDIDY